MDLDVDRNKNPLDSLFVISLFASCCKTVVLQIIFLFVTYGTGGFL